VGFLDIPKRDRLEALWRYQTRGYLWQIWTESPKYLVGEDRDPDQKRVSFFSLERATGRVCWDELNPGDRWWTGIEAVAGEAVLLHGFASPDLPLHMGLTALHIASGEQLWSRPEARFLSLASGSIRVLLESPEGLLGSELDIASGVVLPEVAGEIPLGREAVASPAVFPKPLTAENPSGLELPAGLLKVLPSDVLRESITVAERHGVLAAGFSSPDHLGGRETAFRTRLVLVSGEDGRPLYSDTITEDAPVVGAAQFFLQDDKLFYIKHRSQLVAISLRGARLDREARQ
jgi:hypothetical protein